MSELTDDEFTVLSIAINGESMLPIGRWEKPVKSLTDKGLMRCADPSNYFITDSGRQAWEVRDRADDAALGRLLEVGSQVTAPLVSVQKSAQQSVEQAAVHLALAAKESVKATGDSLEFAIRHWSSVVIRRALELSKDG